MMKKLIPIFFVLVLSSLAFAQPNTPSPVAGVVTIDGEPISNFVVTVTNLATREVISYPEVISLKTENGNFYFDLSNFGKGVYVKDRYAGDVLRIEACVGHPNCVLEFEVVDRVPKTFYIDVSGGVGPVDCPVCPSVSVCPTPINCPESKVCPEPDECPNPEDASPEDVYQYLIGAGGMGLVGIALFFARRKFKASSNDDAFLLEIGNHMSDYTAFRIVKWRGVVRVKHLHPGRSGYHEPTTGHINPDWNHDKGKIIL